MSTIENGIFTAGLTGLAYVIANDLGSFIETFFSALPFQFMKKAIIPAIKTVVFFMRLTRHPIKLFIIMLVLLAIMVPDSRADQLEIPNPIEPIKQLAIDALLNLFDRAMALILPAVSTVAVLVLTPLVLKWGIKKLIYFTSDEYDNDQEIKAIFDSIDFENLSEDDYDLYMEVIAETYGETLETVQTKGYKTDFYDENYDLEYEVLSSDTELDEENIKDIDHADLEIDNVIRTGYLR